jgi:Fe-S cluster assembly protein SufD
VTQVYLSDFATFASNGGGAGPSWLLPLRHRAIERFETLGFPTPRNEDWHYTNVAPIVERRFRAALTAPTAAKVAASDISPFTFGHSEWPTLVFVDGRYSAELSSSQGSDLGKGVRVLDLQSALREEPKLIERHMSKVAEFDQAAFTALNTAFMSDGALIHIAADTVVDQPIHLIFVSTGAIAGQVTYPRNLIVAERHSRATVIESHVGLGDQEYLTNTVTEVVVRAGATLTHLKMQRESEHAYHIASVQVHQERDSHFLQFSFATGAALSRTDIHTVLDGEGSGATLDGVYMASGTQHVDHQTRIEHAQPNTFSREHYKGILDGESHGVFNGKVYVHPHAQKTDGKQENNALLLSERARISAKPELEIFADDVRCTHGSTVGRLDEAALFYMESRGISAEFARKLLTYAFAAGVIENIELEAVRKELQDLTLHRFTD